MNKKPLSVIITTDFMGGGDQTPEEEKVEIAALLQEVLPGRTLNIKHDVMPHTLNEGERCDIYVFDFGGIMPGCEDMVHGNYREFLKAVENFPNTLFIVWSTYSYNHYYVIQRDEDFPQLRDAPNVVVNDGKLEEAIRAFIGD